MDDIINKFYDNQNTITSTTEHDISRFTEVGSPRSMHSTKSNKTFKQLINENYTDYLSKIKPVKFLNTQDFLYIILFIFSVILFLQILNKFY